MKIRKMKSNLDERQELKLLKIEHNGCWIAFWGLLIVMAIQMIVGNDSIKNLAGEWVVFMSLALYLSIDEIIEVQKVESNISNKIATEKDFALRNPFAMLFG